MKINPRALRLTTASILVLSVATIITPRILNYVSTSAVVNAPTITVSSPFHGEVVTSPSVFDIVRNGEEITKVQPSIDHRKQQSDLSAELASRQAQIQATRQEISQLRKDRARQESMRAEYIELSLRKQIAHIADAEAAIAEERALLKDAESRSTRSTTLLASGQVSRAVVDTDQAGMIAAMESLKQAEAQLEALKIDREALQSGLTIASDNTDHDGRIHQLSMRIAALQTELSKLQADEAAIASRIAALDSMTFTAMSTSNAVVQSSRIRPGNAVRDGEEIVRLVDCDNRFLEVAIPERNFESIKPGTSALVFLKGSPNSFQAEVSAVRGAGAKPDYPELAAEPPQVPEGQLRVIVTLDPADLDGEDSAMHAARSCDVGRTAQVRFPRSLSSDIGLFGFGLPSFLSGKTVDIADAVDQ